jgi:hypothetical protein
MNKTRFFLKPRIMILTILPAGKVVERLGPESRINMGPDETYVTNMSADGYFYIINIIYPPS